MNETGTSAAVPLRWVDDVDPRLRAAGALFAAKDADQGIVVHRSGGEIVGANATACEYLGLSWEGLVGRTSRDPRWAVVDRDGLPMPGDRHPAMLTLACGEAVRGVLMGVLHPAHDGEGRTVWLDVSAYPVADPESGQEICGAVAVFADVTDLPAGRHAANTLTTLYRLLAEQASDIVVLSSADGRIEWVSPSVTASLGWSPEDLIGRPPAELIHPDDVAEVLRRIGAAVAAKLTSAEVKARWRTRHGDYRWMSTQGSLITDDNGNIRGGIDALRDIHDEVLERQEHEAAREAEFQLLAENASDVVARLSPDGVVEWISPSIRTVAGWSPDELVGRPLRELVHPEDIPVVDAASERMGGGDFADSEARVRLSDGSYRWFGFTLRLVRGPDGEPYAIVGSARDIDSEMGNRAALAESERRFRRAMMHAPSGMALLHANGALSAVTPALCEMLGLDEPALLADGWIGMLHPADAPTALAEMRAALESDFDSFRRLYRYLRTDGSVVWATCPCLPCGGTTARSSSTSCRSSTSPTP